MVQANLWLFREPPFTHELNGKAHSFGWDAEFFSAKRVPPLGRTGRAPGVRNFLKSRLPFHRRSLCIAVLVFVGCARTPASTVNVAAASDLARVFEALVRKDAEPPKFTFGASGLLARQLAEGAPFDVFAAASPEFAQQAVESGACDASTLVPYARGRLAIFASAGAVRLQDLKSESVKRIAIANPELAPYGAAAKQALVKSGLWSQVQSKVVFTENVRQALQFAQTGNVDAALVAHALISETDSSLPVGSDLYEPLIQTAVVCSRGKNRSGGAQFVQRLVSDEGQALLKSFGFNPP